MDGLDRGLGALLALDGDPLVEAALRQHRLAQAFGQVDAADPLAAVLEPGLELRDLAAQLELVGRIVAEQRVRHVVIRAELTTRVRLVEDRLEHLGQAIDHVAHATILSAYSVADPHGRASCTRLPATW